MKKKYMIKQYLTALAFIIAGILILIPPMITNGGAEIALCGLCAFGCIAVSITHIVMAHNNKEYHNWLREKLKKETINNLLRESNASMEQELTQIRDKKK